MILRFECAEERGIEHETLISATAEPPREPEARVVRNGHLLAESDPFDARWEYTLLGKALIEQEARGELAKCSTVPAPVDSDWECAS